MGRYPMSKSRRSSWNAGKPRRRETLRAAIKFAMNWLRRESSSKTLRTECDGKESEEPDPGSACRRPQENRDAHPGDYTDLHGVQLFLRRHGATRPRVRPGGGGLCLCALRQS